MYNYLRFRYGLYHTTSSFLWMIAKTIYIGMISAAVVFTLLRTYEYLNPPVKVIRTAPCSVGMLYANEKVEYLTECRIEE